MDIYVDIFTVCGSNLMSFTIVCRRVRKFSACVGLLQELLNPVYLNLQVVQSLFKK